MKKPVLLPVSRGGVRMLCRAGCWRGKKKREKGEIKEKTKAVY